VKKTEAAHSAHCDVKAHKHQVKQTVKELSNADMAKVRPDAEKKAPLSKYSCLILNIHCFQL
jgi:hypothetical protein